MTTALDNLGELKCPLCGKMLTSNEFELANEELKARILSKEERKNLLIQIREEERKKHQVEIEELNRRHNENSRKVSDELKTLYKDQIEAIKKSYNELSIRKNDDFNEKTSEYEQQLRNKDRELQKLQDSMNYFKIQATADAKASIQNEIDERDEQIKRLKDKADELGKQLSKTQSELKGEAGETNLLRKLEDAFRRYNDILTPQIRGNSGADIVHQIRTSSGELLCTKIGYDNKEASSVTTKDIEKAKRDKKALDTDYFIVVSKNLPKKEAKNGLCGEKEGIVLAHPDIVTELATIIRSAIIEISKQSACKQDLQTKQVEIYDLIRSREFRRHIESISEAHKKLTDLQKQERKDHETLWKKENAILEDLVNSYNSISTGIDIILDKQDPRTQADEKTENVEKESRENDEGSFSE